MPLGPSEETQPLARQRRAPGPSIALILAVCLGGAGCSRDAAMEGLAEGAYWGRIAFVPDWHEAEHLDALASERFIRDYWPRLHPVYGQGGRGMPGATTQVFLPPLEQAVLPDFLPSTTIERGDAVKLVAARGESEAFALGVRSGDRQTKVEVRFSAFAAINAPHETVSASQRMALAYPARRSPRAATSDNRIRPMVLLKPPDDGWEFPAHTTHSYLIDVHVANDSSAGGYEGKVQVFADQQLIAEVAVELEVLPFQLRVNEFHAGAFGTTYDIWDGGFTGYYPQMMEMDARYGLNMAAGFFNKGNEIPFKRSPTGDLTVDTAHPKFARFDATMSRLKRYGMGDVLFWNWGASGDVSQFNRVLAGAGYPGIHTMAGKVGFAHICAAIKRAEQEFGWPEIVINPFDEALEDQDAVRDLIQSIEYVKKLSPETRLYATEWRENYTRLYQSSGATLGGHERPRWEEHARLRASLEEPQLNFAVIGSNRAFNESRQLQDSLGGEYWHYGAATRVGAWPRFLYGFLPYSVRAEAALSWANYKGGLDGGGWTLHYVMPDRPAGRRAKNTRGPVLASPRALLVREGIDDRKYIETLRYYAVENGSAKDLRYLSNLQQRVRNIADTSGVGGKMNAEGKIVGNDSLDLIRAELRQRILRHTVDENTMIEHDGDHQ